jgi:hypothetical protein
MVDLILYLLRTMEVKMSKSIPVLVLLLSITASLLSEEIKY